jgi:serine phosphatase RsbU (regulator of sigma subunit)
MFGNDRVMSIMNVKSNNSAKELSEALINAAVSWRKNAEAHDDLTVLALKFKGTQNE